jgi:hypothetical protein
MIVAIDSWVTMVITIGISGLIGAALSLRFNVFALVPTAALALVGTGGIGIGHGSPIGSMAFVMVLLTAGLAVGYFGGTIARATVGGSLRPANAANTNAAQNVHYEANSDMFKMLDIRERMEAVGSDGDHVGIVGEPPATRVRLGVSEFATERSDRPDERSAL